MIVHCPSADDLLAQLSPRSTYFADAPPRDWIFRGHANSQWRLLPTAFRAPEKFSEYAFSRPAWEDWRNRDQVQMEAHTVRSFLQEADTVGLPVPGDLSVLLEELDKPFQESWYVRAIEAGDVEWPPQNVWPAVALAQHYGIATRFLDWTRSALIAAYFAATESFAQPAEITSFAIWAFSTSSDAARKGLTFRPGQVTRSVVVATAPYASNPNLHAQGGVHIARPATQIQWLEPAERYDFAHHLEKVGAFGKQFGRTSLVQFVTPRSEAHAVLWYLAKEAITAAQLFPGYGGAARSVLEARLRIAPGR